MRTLADYGWSPFFDALFTEHREVGLVPARVIREARQQYVVQADEGELSAEVSGRFRHEATARAQFPSVGDWVAIAPRVSEARATVHAVLPRRSAFVRRAVGTATEAQVVAANVDSIFLVTGLDQNFNLRRIERYVALAWDSGATPVIVLNKADLAPDAAARALEVARIAPGVDVHALSALDGGGLEVLADRLRPGMTVALLGSSGVGKSTLTNRLAGRNVQATGAVRAEDARGRHTTSHRELVRLPGGALLIDTPGMRELQLWATDEAVDQTFADIAALAERCRFGDCTHVNEAGCAVLTALAEESLAQDRFNSYHKLQREVRYLNRQQGRGPAARGTEPLEANQPGAAASVSAAGSGPSSAVIT
jgi:ribosome biogenesis GTPase